MPVTVSTIRYLSPPQVAERFTVDTHKVLGWIKRGELRAINVASTTGSRPRFRVSPSDLAAFEAARSAMPQPKVSRIRRRKDPSIIEFF